MTSEEHKVLLLRGAVRKHVLDRGIRFWEGYYDVMIEHEDAFREALAEDGWELLSIERGRDGGLNDSACFFIRPLPDRDPWEDRR